MSNQNIFRKLVKQVTFFLQLTTVESTYPNGKKTLVPAILSIFITSLSTTVWATCSFARVQIQSQVGTTFDATDDFLSFDDSISGEFTSYSIGLYKREMLNFEDVLGYLFGSSTATASGCIGYSSEEGELHDASFKTAQALGMMCGVLAFIMMLTFWCIVPCVCIPKRGWQVMGIILFVLGIFQISTLLGVHLSNVCKACVGFRQECVSVCQVSTGGILAIVTSVLWLASGVVCCVILASEDGEDSLPIHSSKESSLPRNSRSNEENENNYERHQHKEKRKRHNSHQHHRQRNRHSPARNHSHSRVSKGSHSHQHRRQNNSKTQAEHY